MTASPVAGGVVDVLAVLGALNLADPSQRPDLQRARAAVQALQQGLTEAAIQAEKDAAKLHYSVHGRALAEQARKWREVLAASGVKP